MGLIALIPSKVYEGYISICRSARAAPDNIELRSLQCTGHGYLLAVEAVFGRSGAGDVGIAADLDAMESGYTKALCCGMPNG